jgi:hypothetical protein
MNPPSGWRNVADIKKLNVKYKFRNHAFCWFILDKYAVVFYRMNIQVMNYDKISE